MLNNLRDRSSHHRTFVISPARVNMKIYTKRLDTNQDNLEVVGDKPGVQVKTLRGGERAWYRTQ